jgi:molybdenum cofactor guanylyltransferase
MEERIPPAAVILAGGISRRMGVEKATIRISGRTQLEEVAVSLSSVVEQTIVAIRHGQDVRSFPPDLPRVADAAPDAGPLAGIVAAHRRLPDHALFVVAVDLFGLDERALRAILNARNSKPQYNVTAAAVIPSKGSARPDPFPDPLCAIWEREVLQAAASAFDQGERNPQVIMRASVVQLVELLPSVVNVNTPADLGKYAQPWVYTQENPP